MAAYPDMTGYLKTLQALTDGQWDFDLGSEEILARHGKAENGRLTVSRQSYRAIVMTKEMENMFSTTIELLSEYMNQGGKIISLGVPGDYVDGEKGDHYKAGLVNHKNWITVDSPEQLEGELERSIGRRMECAKPFETGVEHMCRKLDDGLALYFFMNHSMGKSENIVTVPGSYVAYLDCEKGKMYEYPCSAADGKVNISLSMERFETAMLLVSDRKIETEGRFEKEELTGAEEISAELKQIVPEEKNTLLIEYCDLNIDGKEYKDILALEAGREIFRRRGFSNNPWDNEVQFKDRYLALNHYEEGSGFSAIYHFYIDQIPETAELVVEQGQKYLVFVNGQEISWKNGYFLDKKNKTADIAQFLRTGENTVKLINECFDIFLELEPIYIRGEFGVWNRGGVWTIGEQKVLELGSWTGQGYPMYEGAMRYCYSIDPTEKKQIYVKFPAIETTCATIVTQEEESPIAGAGGRYLFQITPCMEGKKEIEIRVCGSLKNLLGPHHCVGKPRKSAWPEMWRQSPKYGRPKAEDYDLIPYGMTKHIKVYGV